MKKEHLFLILGITIGILQQGPVLAQDADVVSASLDVREGRAAPKWNASLEEIQEVSTTLLTTNHKLTVENDQLKADLAALEARADALRAKNRAAADELADMHRGGDGSGAAQGVVALKAAIAERTRMIAARQAELAALRAQQGSLRAKADLMRLRVAALEIEKKARVVDAQARGQERLAALRAEAALFKDKIAGTQGQIDLLREKAAELQKVDRPYAPQLKEIAAKNVELKESLSALQVKVAPQQAQLDDVMAKKAELEGDPKVRRVNELLAQHEALSARLKHNSEALVALKDRVAAAEKEMAAPLPSAAEVEKFERQNAAIGEEISSLRENIALLEYKVNSLQRYKDRNKPDIRSR